MDIKQWCSFIISLSIVQQLWCVTAELAARLGGCRLTRYDVIIEANCFLDI